MVCPAQWEYAARAGTSTTWYWGDDEQAAGDYAWYGTNSDGRTHPVGEKLPNPFGLYDMAGNVWEWTGDWWHGDYRGDPTDGSAWLADRGGDGARRVVRGGSWSLNPDNLRSAYRFRGSTGLRLDYLGFRVACRPHLAVDL